MKILLHICCAPCAVHCVDAIKKDSYQLEGFFYNPNIHPTSEYNNRRLSCKKFAEEIGLKVQFERDYQFEDFFRKITFHEDNSRCEPCWRLRLNKTAEYAKKNGFQGFTSSLFISPYQDHKKLRTIATEASDKYSIPFIYIDFRPGFRESHKASKEMGLYHQKYCGCIYSERERLMSLAEKI